MSTPVHSAGRRCKVIGFLLIVIGIFSSMAASSQTPPSSGAFGFFLMAAGFVTFLVGRFQD
jgi:energy-coupling factor transporter transmembrane protein EcfT